MLPGGGKAKGSAFERHICDRLSLWVSHSQSHDLFWRSAMSGGRATVGARKGVDLRRQAGDICAVAPEGHSLTDRFYIECKHVNSLDIESFIVKRRGKLAAFWEVAKREAKRHGRLPMIIARQNRLPTLMLVREYPPVKTVKDVLAMRPGHWRLFTFDQVMGLPYDDNE